MKKYLAYRHVVALLISLMTLGCSDFGDQPQEPLMWVDGKHLYLGNANSDTLYYFLCPTALVPVVDWFPCSNPSQCTNRLKPKSTTAIDYSSFWWMADNRSYDELTVYTWQLTLLTNGAYRVEGMQSAKVRLL